MTTQNTTQQRPRVCLSREPIAKLTKFGWIIVSPEKETGVKNMLFSKHPYMIMKNFAV